MPRAGWSATASAAPGSAEAGDAMGVPPRFLVIGYGNPGRLDDGLGPALAEALERKAIPGVTVESDYQLAVEDAAQIAEHDVVVFADAAVAGREPFFVRRVGIRPLEGLGSHTIEPEALMALARDAFGAETRGFALGIRGYEFNEFGERISDRARRNLDAALEFLEARLRSGTFDGVETEGGPAAAESESEDMR